MLIRMDKDGKNGFNRCKLATKGKLGKNVSVNECLVVDNGEKTVILQTFFFPRCSEANLFLDFCMYCCSLGRRWLLQHGGTTA